MAPGNGVLNVRLGAPGGTPLYETPYLVMRGSGEGDLLFPSYSWEHMDIDNAIIPKTHPAVSKSGADESHTPSKTHNQDNPADSVGGADESHTPPKSQLPPTVAKSGAGESHTPGNATGGTNPQAGGSSLSAPPAEGVERLSLEALSLKRKAVSGAARRRIAREKAREEGRPVPPRKKKTKPLAGAGSSKTGDVRKGGKAEAKPAPTSTPAPKRPREAGSNPPSAGSKPPRVKKAKAETGDAVTPPTTSVAGLSFSQALTTQRMAVVLGKFPEQLLTSEQGQTVIKALTRAVFEADPDSERRFDGVSQRDGVVLVTCCSVSATTWLVDTVRGLRLEGLGELRAGSARDLLGRPRVSVLIPTEGVEGKDIPSIVKLLGRQNPGLHTDKWRVFSSKKEAKSILLCAEVPEADLLVLRGKGLRVGFGLRTVTFRVLRKARPADAEGGSDQPTA